MSYKFALAPYIKTPEKYPNVVLFYDENVVIIKDAFPKSKVHLLILPRNAQLTNMKPQIAFTDIKNRTMIAGYIEQAKELGGKIFNKEWRRIDGHQEDIPFIVCCHAIPSLNNLHIHVLTEDMCGSNMKNKKHYNSFNTRFAIKMSEFPLKEHEEERSESLLKQRMIYKGVDYGGSFKKLKEMLTFDFESVYKQRI